MLFRRDFRFSPWMKVALAAYGLHGPPKDSYIVHAVGSATAGTPAVTNFFHGIHDGHYGQDWCAAFVNFCLRDAHVAGTGSSGARFFLTSAKFKPVMPTWGCITVLYRGPHHSPTKHVGFLVEHTKTDVLILGGNQRVQPNSSSDHWVSFHRAPVKEVEAYRWPVDMAVPVLTNTGQHAIK